MNKFLKWSLGIYAVTHTIAVIVKLHLVEIIIELCSEY